jgi:hypothetical protein
MSTSPHRVCSTILMVRSAPQDEWLEGPQGEVRYSGTLSLNEGDVEGMISTAELWEREPISELYFLSDDGDSHAGMTFFDLRAAIFEGKVNADTLLHRGVSAVWLRAGDIEGLFVRKSKPLCAFLAVVLGVFGADRFYLGHIGLGFAKAALFLLGLLSVAASFVLGDEPLVMHLTEPSVGAMLLHGAFGWVALDMLLLLVGALRVDGDGVPIAWR